MADVIDLSARAEAEPEMFDATNIDHARKLAAALWAVEVSVTVHPAPDAQRVVLRKIDGSGAVVAEGSPDVELPPKMQLASSDGHVIDVERDPTVAPTIVPMIHMQWVAKFGDQRFGDGILLPADREADGIKSLSLNMVRTMLALVVNGVIGKAPVEHGN